MWETSFQKFAAHRFNLTANYEVFGSNSFLRKKNFFR